MENKYIVTRNSSRFADCFFNLFNLRICGIGFNSKQILSVLLISLICISCHKDKAKTVVTNAKVYTLTIAKQQSLPTTLRLPAQLIPYESVEIYPKVNGYIKDMYVDMGRKVKKGQLLMLMEAPEVEQNSLQAHETYIKGMATYNDSRDQYHRLLKTSETAGTVSPNDLEAAQAKMQSDSAQINSEKAAWKAMEALKDYLVVRAPFDGTITQRNVHPGALVTIGKTDAKPMLELQETNRLRLRIDVPEEYATQLADSQSVSFTAEGLPGKTFTGKMSRQAYSVDDKYRNESMEIDVWTTDSAHAGLMPGMYVEVLLPLKGHDNALVVPEAAVITSTERKYVIKASDHRANFVDVQTGNENNGMIEIFGQITAGDTVIANASEDVKQNQIINK